MANIADKIEEGRVLAMRIGQYPHSAHHEISKLSESQLASLDAFRAHEMSRAVAQVESSNAGEHMRFAAAKAVYRATLAQRLEITPEAIIYEENR